MSSKKKINPASETIAACIRGILADAQAIQKAAKATAAAQGKTLELRDPTPEDVGELIHIEDWPYLFKNAKKDAREGVRAVIEGKKSRDELTAGNLLLSMVENYLIATARKYESGQTFTEAARANAEALAGLLNIEKAAMLKYCEELEKRIEADREQYLPTMKPSPCEIQRQAAARLNTSGLKAITQQFMLKQPEKREVFSHWRGDLYLPFIHDEAPDGETPVEATISGWIDRRTGKEVTLKITYPKGQAGRIDRFDQVVENALSRLFKRCIEAGIKQTDAVFTLEQIYCEMAGNTNATRPSSQMLTKIMESCDRLRETKIEATAIDRVTGESVEGQILHLDKHCIFTKRGKGKIGYKVLDQGKLTQIESCFWDPLNIPSEVLNIGEGNHGVSITETSLVIARFLMQEVFRIKKSEYLTPESRTISLARIIDDEASEALTEYQNGLPIVIPGKPPRHQPKQSAGASPKEQEAIRNARRHRRELAGRILAGWADKGFIKSARLNADKSGFIIDVEKTEKAAKRIEHKDRQTKKIGRLTAAADRKKPKKGGGK